jgi:hypothetical protein
MSWTRVLGAAIAAVLFGSAPAPAFVKCQMPNGKLLFVDVPPAGCVVKGEMKNAPEAAEPPSEASAPNEDGEGANGSAATDSGNAQAIAGGRRIERELAGAADEWDRLQQERANAPKSPPGVYVDVTDGSGQYHENERVRPDVAAELDAREKQIRDRIQGLRDEYTALTGEVTERHGGSAPSWWRTTPRCDRCP